MNMWTFKGYLEAEGKSKNTVKCYNYYLTDFLAWLDTDNTDIDEVTGKEIMSYLNYLQKEKKQENKSRSYRLGAIKHYYNWRIHLGHRGNNPVTHIKLRGIKSKKLYPVLNRQELEKIYVNYQTDNRKGSRQNTLGRKRNKTIISLLINQALTTAEIARIELQDLNLREGKLFIQGGRKSNERNLDLKPNQIIDLMEYSLQTRKDLLGYQSNPNTKRLFLALPPVGRNKTTSESLHIWKTLTAELKQAHPKLINLQQVRASVITHWLKVYNLRQAQYMAGHRYISSTESYLNNQIDDLQADIDKFHPF